MLLYNTNAAQAVVNSSSSGKRPRIPEHHHDPSGGGCAFDVDERRRTQTQSRHVMAPVSISPVPFLPTAASEETTLRASFVREEDERPKVPHDRFSDDVPVVSLQGIDDDGARRDEIRARVAAACEDWGIFQVVDHGVDAELVAEMARLARDFFALPAEDKLRFDMSGGKKGGFIVSSHLQVYKRARQMDGRVYVADAGTIIMFGCACRGRLCRTGVRS